MPETKNLSDLKVADIRKELKVRGLDTKGVKAQLIQRLTEALRGEGEDPEHFVVCENENMPIIIQGEETSPNSSLDNNTVSPMENAEVSTEDNAEVSTEDNADGAETQSSVSVETKHVPSSEVTVDIEEIEDKKPEQVVVSTVRASETEETAADVNKDSEKQEVVAETLVPNVELIEQTSSDLKEIPAGEEGEKAQTADMSEIDDDTDQDALRLTIGDEDAIGEYDFQEEYRKDDEEEETEKESDVTEGSKSSVPDSVKGGKAIDSEEKTQVDSKPQSVISDATDGKTETATDSLNLSSSTTSESKIPEEGSPDMKRKDGFVVVANELCSECTASEIKLAFQKYGKIVGVKVISNNKTTGARRFAHVEMSSEEDVIKCISESNEIKIHGHQLSAQRASVDGSPAKKGGKSDHHSNGGVDEQKPNSNTKTKTSEERKASSVATTSPGSSSKQKDVQVDKKEKPSVEKKSKESSSSKDGSEKDKGKEKSKDHSGKGEKDKKTSSTKDSKKSDSDKSKSGSGGTPSSGKSGTEAQGGRKMELRKDNKARFFDKRRTFNPPRNSGFQRGNEAPGSGPPIRSSYHPRTTTPFHYRGRSPRSPQINLSRQCLTFDKIREHRERERMRENERKLRERERRRRDEEEKQRMIEKRNKEEFLSLERERQQLRMERERVERDKQELMRIQKERQRTERENIEKEREELRRAQMKIEEHRRLLKRPFVENKEYLERKKPLITDIVRFEGTSRPDTFMPRHEAKLEQRSELDRHDRDPRLDRGNLLRASPREFIAPPARTSVRLADRDDDWGDRSGISRDPRMELKKAIHSDDRRAGRVRGRAPGDLAADYAGSYRPSAYAPMKISDHFQNDKGDYGRKSLERKIPPSSSAGGDSLMPSHFATDRVWSSNRKSEPSWNTPDKLSGRSGHHSSDRWSSPSANVSGLSGSRASSNILPPVSGLPSASSSMYPAVSGSSAAASGSSGRSSHLYSTDEFTYGRFRRF